MSIRHLDSLFDPASIVVIGASQRVGSVGTTVWGNLSAGHYKGVLYAVNPKYRELNGYPVLAHVSDLPIAPDLAVICTPPSTIAGLIKALAKLGTRAAVILTPGMNVKQKLATQQAARPNLLRLLGPGCMGLLVPHKGFNASCSHTDALPGELAFVSQSNALVATMLDWAQGRGIGFSQLVSLGEHADVDFGDVIDYLASDPKTRGILLFAESIMAPRKFMSAARAAARNKPVIILKAGRAPQGLDCDLVFDAAIARAGMLRVNTLLELFLAAEMLARFRGNESDSITILTNGGGAGLLAADAAAHSGVTLSKLSDTLCKQLDAVLPPNWSHANPVDITGDAPVERYVKALQILNADPASGAILFVHTPTVFISSVDIAHALLPLAHHENISPPRLMSSWLDDPAVKQAQQIFRDAGIATFDTPELAVQAFSMLARNRRNQQELAQAPAALTLEQRPDSATIKALVKAVLATGRNTLTGPEVRAVLDACHMALVPTAHTTQRFAQAVRLRVGSRIDPVFGPVILLGLADKALEQLEDRAVALPPMNLPLARALVSRTRIANLLAKSGDPFPVDETALHRVLVAVSELLAEIPEIAELEINPLIVNFEGAIVLDARISLSATAPAGANNFAIRPYPVQLEETVQWQGRALSLRPIRPEDESMHQEFLQQLDPQDVRMRVFYSKRTMERSELARLVQIDYAREMAFIATAPGPQGKPETLGVVRAMIDPDNIDAEFGVIVSSALKGHGLGHLLMQKMVAYLRTQGTKRMVATVLDYNDRMLKLAKALGFQENPASQDGEGTKEICLPLT